MHDDDTSKVPPANRMPWETEYEAPQGRVTMDPTTSTRVDEPRRGIGAWGLPILLVLTGVAAFAIVTFFMTGKSNDGPTSVSVPASGQRAPSTPPSSSSSSSTSEAQDDFPASAAMTCMEDEVETSNPSSDVVRMVSGSNTSCAFLRQVRSDVLEHLDADRAAADFTMTSHSTVTGGDYVMSCQRHNHLTYCTGGNSAKIYVKDTAA